MLKYYNKVVLYNHLISNGIGIITGWKNPPEIKNLLNEETLKKVMTIGTLYTKEGINHIIANLFLNPQITHLILLKDSDINNEISTSIKSFLKLINEEQLAFQEQYQFTKEQIHEFCTYFKNHISIIPSAKLNEEIAQKIIPNVWRNDIIEIAPKELANIKNLRSEQIGFFVRADQVKTAWERGVKLISNYGILKKSDYDENQLELMDLSMIVRKEDIMNPSMISYLGITKKELDEYAESMLSKKMPDNIRYTYGSRFRNYENIDQLEYLEKSLKEKEFTRRAVATLWNPNLDTLYDEVPCIDLYQAIIQNKKLYFIAYFRANDILNAYPRNIYGILKIQEELCERLKVSKGYVNTIAGSAHIYSRDFNLLKSFDKNISFCEEDERGYFYIEVKEKDIQVSFYTKEGILERQFKGNNANKLRSECCFLISNIDHAFYLGQELTKAEMALENNLPYIQDQKLSLKLK